jgi:hypothetical protein
MLLRICLIVAIVASAGVITVSHLKVRPHVQAIIDAREKNARDRDIERNASNKAQVDLKTTKAELDSTKSTLAETQTQLASAKSQAETENKLANGLTKDLAATEQARNESEQKLARWNQILLDPSQVQDVIASEKNLRANNDDLKEQLKNATKEVALLNKVIEDRIGDIDPPLPAGLKGKVLSVDPKWDFVVLDIGEKQGLKDRGVLMVSRGSKLVAKVRVKDLDADKCIADIMPGWKLSEVMEGDHVFN